MNTSIRTPIVLALLLAFSGTACTEVADGARQTAAEATQAAAEATAKAAGEGGALSEAFAEAREKMQTENLPLGHVDGLPKAELTPEGDLLVDGVAVPITPAQREATLVFRAELLGVGEAGMVMGEKGAGIASDALALAAQGIFGGDTSEAEARIEAKGKAMEADAMALCQRVAGLEAAQNRLAELLPAFKPYAKAIDVQTDCNVADTTQDAEQKADDTSAPTDTVST